ncbi:hypothetical protein [Streptomyces sp. KS 21]|nr:hypothetical protein [Streptomyces sp. KS 21]
MVEELRSQILGEPGVVLNGLGQSADGVGGTGLTAVGDGLNGGPPCW